jgi:hypothetical protein
MELRRLFRRGVIDASFTDRSIVARGMHAPSSQTAIALMAVFFSVGGCLIIGLIWYFWRKYRRRRAEFRELRRQMELAMQSHASSTRCPTSRVDEEAGEGAQRGRPTERVPGRGQAQSQSGLPPLPPDMAALGPGLTNVPPGSGATMPLFMKRMLQAKMRERGMQMEDAQRQLEAFGIHVPLEELQRILGDPYKGKEGPQRSVTDPPPQLPTLYHLTGTSQPPPPFQSFPSSPDQSPSFRLFPSLPIEVPEEFTLAGTGDDMASRPVSDDPHPATAEPRSSSHPRSLKEKQSNALSSSESTLPSTPSPSKEPSAAVKTVGSFRKSPNLSSGFEADRSATGDKQNQIEDEFDVD